ncbi:hypothetical protein Tco_0183768 [Tanacetum coccineum]
MEVEGEDNKDDEENESNYDDDGKPKKNEHVESGYNLDASVTAHKLKEDCEHIRTNGNSNTQKVNLYDEIKNQEENQIRFGRNCGGSFESGRSNKMVKAVRRKQHEGDSTKTKECDARNTRKHNVTHNMGLEKEKEMKCGKVEEQWVEDLWGSRNFGYAQVEANGKSGGLLLVWDTKIFSASQSVGDERFIVVKADVELKDTIVVVVPKFLGEGYHMKTIRVDYKWRPLRCLSCKVFGHVLGECPKQPVSVVLKNLKAPRQIVRGVLVGPKVGFKQTKYVYRPVSQKNS